jgi:integrase
LTGLRCSESVKGKIVNTLIKLRRKGLAEGTLRNISFNLKHLAKHTNLDNPEAVKEYIAKKRCANSFKMNLVKAYNYYAVVNGIQWIKPNYRHERKLPKIPTTEQINKLIASASPRYATILKILAETGIMPHELSRISLRDIDLERGLLNVHGHKGHNSRVFKLKAETIAMLRTYLAKNHKQYPFPKSEWICKCYREHRNRIAEKLNEPSLRTIRLYDFRHYYATMLYYRTKDILLVKQQLGHKKLETTLIYTQLVSFNEEDEFYSATATTIKEARQLIEQGFEYVTEIDGVKLFRKRK